MEPNSVILDLKTYNDMKAKAEAFEDSDHVVLAYYDRGVNGQYYVLKKDEVIIRLEQELSGTYKRLHILDDELKRITRKIKVDKKPWYKF